ncbi:MAG TPA: N-acetylmuramoyl-L-alanine amidase [Clostridia bacterium]|nr:N-acetylmuramoyl-L-alanine amidase [Clostridia bacterium]
MKTGGARRLTILFLCVLMLAPLSGCIKRETVPDTVAITPAVTTPSASAVPSLTPSATFPPAATLAPSPVITATPPLAEPMASPLQTPSPAPTASPKPTKRPQNGSDEEPLSGLVIGVDPGHQAHSDSDTEPVAPGSSTMKKKVSSGTRGVATGVYEYEVNLAVGLLLRDMLEQAGATVVMTHTKANVNISNIERAEIFNDNSVDLGVRLHCNGNTDHSVRGAFMLVPKSKSYPYYDDCVLAAKAILKAYGEETGLNTEKGITYRSDQTGFNWCTRPVTNIEMGHMTNADEDRLLTDADFQAKMARGIYNGIVAYFKEKAEG